MLEDVPHVALGARRVDRRADRSDEGEREVEERPFELGPADQRERVSLGDPEGEQPVRDLVDGLAASSHDTGTHSPSTSWRYAGSGAVLLWRRARAFAIVRSPVTAAIYSEEPIEGARNHAVPLHFLLQMRTSWNGSVSFGLVNIPVGLAPATKPAARQSDVSFRMLHRECGTPIKQKRYCPVHERDVESDELVRGWEVAKGQFVMVEDADLEAIEQRDTSRSIEISRFVRLEEVDPIFFDRTYFLVPPGAEAARRPYVLLLEAMKEGEVAALGRFVLAGKEKLCLIRPMGDALALETLFVARGRQEPRRDRRGRRDGAR